MGEPHPFGPQLIDGLPPHPLGPQPPHDIPQPDGPHPFGRINNPKCLNKDWGDSVVTISIALSLRTALELTGHLAAGIHLFPYRTNPSLQKQPSMQSVFLHSSLVAVSFSVDEANRQAAIHFLPHFSYTSFSDSEHTFDTFCL